MKLHLVAACALAAASLAGSAFAEGRITATLESPTPSKTKFIAAHAVFVCQDTVCSSLAPDEAYSVRGCTEIAKKVGRLSAYAMDKRSLTGEQLESCNVAAGRAAPKTATAAN